MATPSVGAPKVATETTAAHEVSAVDGGLRGNRRYDASGRPGGRTAPMVVRGGRWAMIAGIVRPVGARAAFGAVDHPGDRVQTVVPPALA